MDTAAPFSAIPAQDCRLLVRGHSVGRVAWSGPAGTQVLPVSYAVVGEQILFRTDPGSILGALAEPTPVAFQVDDIDTNTATGWAVLVQGEAARFDGEPPTDLHPWVPGDRGLVIAVTPTAYSGRVVSAEQRS